METADNGGSKNRSKAMLKAAILFVFILTAIIFVRYTPIKEYLNAEALGRFLATAGIWAPVVFMATNTHRS